MPKFKKYRSEKLVNINTANYAVDWGGDCRSKFQKQVKVWLHPYWKMDICLEEMPVPGTRYSFDLVNLSKMIIVETNGIQHSQYNSFFHGKNRFNFHEQIVRDEAKREWSVANGFTLVEIEPTDLPLTREFFFKNYGIQLTPV
jgi:hypothetical protein